MQNEVTKININNNITLHIPCTSGPFTLHSTLHHFTLHCTSGPLYIKLHPAPLDPFTLHSTLHLWTPLHYKALVPLDPLHYTAPLYTTLHLWTPLHYTALWTPLH